MKWRKCPTLLLPEPKILIHQLGLYGTNSQQKCGKTYPISFKHSPSKDEKLSNQMKRGKITKIIQAPSCQSNINKTSHL